MRSLRRYIEFLCFCIDFTLKSDTLLTLKEIYHETSRIFQIACLFEGQVQISVQPKNGEETHLDGDNCL